MIEVVSELGALRARVSGWRREGLRVGFVPTMGNLHAGHRSLVALARERAERVVASVFVNPTQFGPGEDFARYPRTPDDDVAALRDAGCDLAWLPSIEAMYPLGIEAAVRIRVPGITFDQPGGEAERRKREITRRPAQGHPLGHRSRRRPPPGR